MRILLNDNLSGYSETDLKRDLALLPAWRRDQAEHYKHFIGRRNCTLSLLLLAEGLGVRPSDILPFHYNEHGKPCLTNCTDRESRQIHFNMSHCREAVACIIADHPCGIDVESAGRYSESVARYSMNEDEQDIIHKSPIPSHAFVHLWTRKEALLKAIGTGIQDNMRDIFSHHTDIDIHTREHIDRGYILSYCVLTDTKDTIR